MGEQHGPIFEPLSDPDFFAQVRVDDEPGTVVWPRPPRSICETPKSRILEPDSSRF